MSVPDTQIHRPSLGDPASQLGGGGAPGAIDACRRAGLPVIQEQDCTCGLAGRLVVLASPDGLRVIWPYHRPCRVHDP